MATRYTICEAKNERNCRNKLCLFTKDLLRHSSYNDDSLNQLKEICIKLQDMSIRFNILEKSIPNNIPYSTDVLNNMKCEILHSANKKQQNILQIIKCLHSSYQQLQQKFKEFHQAMVLLNLDLETDFILGNATQKSIEYYCEKGLIILYHYDIYYKQLIFLSSEFNFKKLNTITSFISGLCFTEDFLNIIRAFILNSKCLTM